MTSLTRLLGRRLRGVVRGRIRLLLAAGLSVGLMFGGTYAIWTDDATATTGSFQAGTVDITLGADHVEDYTIPFAAGALWPGDARSQTFAVHNDGTLPFTFGTSYEVTGGWTYGGRTALAVAIAGGSGTLQPGASTTVTVTVTFQASQITASTGAASFQGASGDVIVTFDATNT